ncbi:hypothetical protein [Variovorax sp. DXTD-1]|nr:hypothetical protein [Variovorax sp. DXTD-1]
MKRAKRKDRDDSAAAHAVPCPGHWADPLGTLQRRCAMRWTTRR